MQASQTPLSLARRRGPERLVHFGQVRLPSLISALQLSLTQCAAMESGMVATAPSLAQEVQAQTERDCETVSPSSPRGERLTSC